MCPIVYVLGKAVPSYGIMIVLGVVIANLLIMCKLKKNEYMDFLIMEGYLFLGGILGAKILYLIVSAKDIDWTRWNDFTYMNNIIVGGFVFYGGLIGGIIGYLLAGKWHHIPNYHILERVIFGLPIAHGFGRVGCHLAGCCYGVEYTGAFAVTYPNVSFGPCGVSCFPIQLLEAFLLWQLAFFVYMAMQRNWRWRPVEVYVIGYSLIRFFLEFLRGDQARGAIGVLSTSQIISVLLILGVCISEGVKKKRNRISF